mmetsp:Transcript_64423/g.152385  ORF Transcript_64423/g.152385 Transcript_64423/m.152385 type:complete len:213 (-) Transcript_64423:457-1095(-)
MDAGRDQAHRQQRPHPRRRTASLLDVRGHAEHEQHVVRPHPSREHPYPREHLQTEARRRPGRVGRPIGRRLLCRCLWVCRYCVLLLQGAAPPPQAQAETGDPRRRGGAGMAPHAPQPARCPVRPHRLRPERRRRRQERGPRLQPRPRRAAVQRVWRLQGDAGGGRGDGQVRGRGQGRQGLCVAGFCLPRVVSGLREEPPGSRTSSSSGRSGE